MGVEKQGSKGGGSVGGFFQLFDWNAKSRKKLFSNKSDFTDQSKQKKKSDGNLPMTQLHLMDEEENVVDSIIKGSSNYSCASSVTDEDGYGSRAPGVVARLMGLDSLPTPNLMEPYPTPFFDSQSLRDAHICRKNIELHNDHQIMHSGNLHHKVEGGVRNFMEPKPWKMINMPIEKFQTEILPPKSAKSIPITHHKLLSPIKSPSFIPSKNLAHIMEAAAKMIEPGLQTTTKAKVPLVGASSVPLKVRDLKEKVEAAKKPSRLAEASRRPVESNAAKYLKGKSMNKSWNGSVVDTSSFREFSDSVECSAGSKSKGKSISLALQAKANVQKREGLNLGSRSLFGQKEQSEVISSKPFKSQPNIRKSTHKKPSTHSASSVLKQNNQKQNCPVDRERLPSKPLVSASQSRKVLSEDSSLGRNKSSSKFARNSKVGSRKLGLEVIDGKKEDSYSGTKNVSRKKRSIDGNFHIETNQVIDKKEKPIQSNSVIDGHFSCAEDSIRKGMDVVSFTFTAPMTRSIPDSEISRRVEEKNNSFSEDYRGKKMLLNLDSTNSTKLSSLRYNVIGSDSLSILLEQKLRELTHGVDSSHYKVGTAGNAASIFQDLVPVFKGVRSTTMSHDRRNHDGIDADKSAGQYGPDFSSTDPQGLVRKLTPPGAKEMDECSSNAETRKLLDCWHPSPISVLDPSLLLESCNSSDTAESNSAEGGKLCSVQAQEMLGMNSSKKFHLMEADTELSDSASSTSLRIEPRKHVTTLSMTNFVGSIRWELEYVKEILSNVELMFRDFALGRAREIINPHLFDQLESRKWVLKSHGDDHKLRRKVLFDYVSECMDLRCRRYVGGGSATWAKGLSVLRRKERLAEEVYKEISGWRGMGIEDCMVDELVDKDMSSSQYGRWLDFEVEAFELGVDIERRIINSLIDEVAADLLQF